MKCNFYELYVHSHQVYCGNEATVFYICVFNDKFDNEYIFFSPCNEHKYLAIN